jgi:hypothetical protein
MKYAITTSLCLSIALFGAALALLGLTLRTAPSLQTHNTAIRSTEGQTPAYHSHPPEMLLPQTLDASSFEGNHKAYVAYTLTARVREVLYQEPCLCHCNRFAGHESLFDCYTSKHGATCYTCQAEAVFCYEQTRKGWGASRIRKAIFAGTWKLPDFERHMETLYEQFHSNKE